MSLKIKTYKYYALSVVNLAICLMCTSSFAHGASPLNKDWPCIQRKVINLSAGTIWTGTILTPEQINKEPKLIRDALKTIAPRRINIEQAKAHIDQLATQMPAKVEQRKVYWAHLFYGLLKDVNQTRSDIMAGIERFSRRQKQLAERVNEQRRKISELESKTNKTADETSLLKDSEEKLEWDARIFDEREKSLEYVCEAPILLEQRLYALAKHILTKK